MRKWWFLVLVISIVCLSALLLRKKPVVRAITPEVLDVGPSQVSIVWPSKDAYKGHVVYWPANDQQSTMSAFDAVGESGRHEVILTGLKPATRYVYQVDGSDNSFMFQTQPLAGNPFSFLLVWGDISEQIVSLVRTEFADFVVSLNTQAFGEKDIFAAVRPCIPVYGLTGLNSPFLTAINRSADSSSAKPWMLEWGGLSLVFVDDSVGPAVLDPLLSTQSAHTIGLLVCPSKTKKSDAEQLSRSELHAGLTMHNARYPANPVSFVLMLGDRDETILSDQIAYCTIAAGTHDNSSGAVRMDIDVDSVRATFLNTNTEVTLKEPPLGKKLVCEDCRRLADKGAYEASIEAYMEFIEANNGHFQIEDAYYAIANIFDFKLFDFEKALAWYRRLIQEYPRGTLVPLANQRIKYILAYSDCNYEPLARFERIRSVEFSRKKEELQHRLKMVADVEGLIADFPECNLAPVMQLWVANQYRADAPDRAVENYRKLKADYGSSEQAREALFEIGATYYDAARYSEAIAAFQDALKELPDLADTINAQIARAHRNIRRVHLSWLCWGITAVIGIMSAAIKPRFIGTKRLVRCIFLFAVMAGLLYAAAWLIREQFNSVAILHGLVLSFAAVTALSVFVITKLTSEAMSRQNNRGLLMALLPGIFAAMLFYLAGVFLAVYCVYEHYLIILNL